jgi:streptogramin lyase
VGGRQSLAGMNFTTCDVVANPSGDLVMEEHRITAIKLDRPHGDNHSVTIMSRTLTAPRAASEIVDHELVIREARRRQRRRWLVITVIIVVATCVAAIVAGSTGGSVTSGRRSPGPARSHRVAPVTTRGLPLSGNVNPIDLTPDPSGDGVWFLASSAASASIYRWNGSKLTSYVLGDPASDPQLMFGIQAGLAVTTSGQPWVGIGATLYTVDVATSVVRSVELPAPCTNQAIESPQLNAAQKSQDIQSLATSPDGIIAITRSGANCVQTYDPRTNTFRQIALPAGHEPLQVAYDSSGELAVATTVSNSSESGSSGVDDDMDLVNPSGKVSSVSVDAVTVEAATGPYSGFVAAGGQGEVDTLSDSGAVTPSVLSGHPTVTLEVGTPAYRLSNGSVIAATTNGFAVLNSSNSGGSLIGLGSFDCSGASIPPQPGVSSAPPTKMTCENHPLDFAVDSRGNIWFSAAGPGDPVREVQASSYIGGSKWLSGGDFQL